MDGQRLIRSLESWKKNCWVGISSFIFNSIENFAEFILCEFKADEVADKYESTKSF